MKKLFALTLISLQLATGLALTVDSYSEETENGYGYEESAAPAYQTDESREVEPSGKLSKNELAIERINACTTQVFHLVPKKEKSFSEGGSTDPSKITIDESILNITALLNNAKSVKLATPLDGELYGIAVTLNYEIIERQDINELISILNYANTQGLEEIFCRAEGGPNDSPGLGGGKIFQ